MATLITQDGCVHCLETEENLKEMEVEVARFQASENIKDEVSLFRELASAMLVQGKEIDFPVLVFYGETAAQVTRAMLSHPDKFGGQARDGSCVDGVCSLLGRVFGKGE